MQLSADQHRFEPVGAVVSIDRLLRWLPKVSCKVKKCKFQPQKLVPMAISEKNETKVRHGKKWDLGNLDPEELLN